MRSAAVILAAAIAFAVMVVDLSRPRPVSKIEPATPTARIEGNTPSVDRRPDTPSNSWLGLVDSVHDVVALVERDARLPGSAEITALEAEPDGYRAASAESLRASLSFLYQDGSSIEWQGRSMRIHPTFASAPAERRAEGLVYRLSPEAAAVVLPLKNKIEELLLLNTENAVRTPSYEIVRQPWMKRALPTACGSVEFWGEEAPWLRLDPIEALDAGGKRFPGSWNLRETGDGWIARIEIDLRGAEFPVVVDPAWSSTATMTTSRYNHTLTPLQNGTVLAAGGNTGPGETVLCEIFNATTGTWQSTGSLTSARESHIATLLDNGTVLAAGGGWTASSTCELYNPSSGTWSTTGSLTYDHVGHTATRLSDGRILITGGGGAPGTLSGCEIYSPTTGTWIQAASMSNNRDTHAAALLSDGQVFVCGGTLGGATAEIYNPSTNAWASVPSMSTARIAHTATLLSNGRVLVTGGVTGTTAYASAEFFDPSYLTWSSAGSMSAARYFQTATMLPNGRVLIAGGRDSSVWHSSCDLYDPATNSWSASASLNAARYAHSAVMLPTGQVLISGGAFPATTTSEIHHPDLGSWTATTSLPASRSSHTMTLLPNGTILVASGSTSAAITQTCLLYDPVTTIWSSAGAVATARLDHEATLLPDGRVLVSGGRTSSGDLSSCEIYTPSLGTWSPTASLSTARYSHTTTLLPDGRVLAAGGRITGGAGILSYCEIFDPATGTWSTTGSLSSARGEHAATLLNDGRVLVTGGILAYTSAEIFNPATGSWSSAGTMSATRRRHTSALLPDGRVLVAGGADAALIATTSCDLFNPATSTWTATGAFSVARSSHSATMIPGGNVLVCGGNDSASYTATCEIYSPSTGTWRSTASMSITRGNHTAVLLTTSRVLVLGGGVSTVCELYEDSGTTDVWRPTISAVNGSAGFPVDVPPGSTVTLSGTLFRGISEGGTGAGARHNSADHPVVRLTGTGSTTGNSDSTVSRYFILPASAWSSGTSLTFTAPSSTNNPLTWYLLHVIVNGIPSEGKIIRLTGTVTNNPPATVFSSSLSQHDSPSDSAAIVGFVDDDSSMTFRGTVTDPDGDPVSMQIEVKPVGTAFDGTSGITSGSLVASGGTSEVTVSGMANGLYQWRARASDGSLTSTSWTDFGFNLSNPPAAAADTDFETAVTTVVPPTPTPTPPTPLTGSRGRSTLCSASSSSSAGQGAYVLAILPLLAAPLILRRRGRSWVTLLPLLLVSCGEAKEPSSPAAKQIWNRTQEMEQLHRNLSRQVEQAYRGEIGDLFQTFDRILRLCDEIEKQSPHPVNDVRKAAVGVRISLRGAPASDDLPHRSRFSRDEWSELESLAPANPSPVPTGWDSVKRCRNLAHRYLGDLENEIRILQKSLGD